EAVVCLYNLVGVGWAPFGASKPLQHRCRRHGFLRCRVGVLRDALGRIERHGRRGPDPGEDENQPPASEHDWTRESTPPGGSRTLEEFSSVTPSVSLGRGSRPPSRLVGDGPSPFSRSSRVRHGPCCSVSSWSQATKIFRVLERSCEFIHLSLRADA